MEEVKFIKTGDDFSNIATQLRQEYVDYLTQATKENGTIVFDLEQEDECVYVSDFFSMVYSVSFNDDKNRLSIETEDDDDYTVKRMSTEQLYALSLAVYNNLKG